MIDEAIIRHVATLAQLEVEPEALPVLAEQLAAILEHVRHLEEVDVTGVPPMAHAAGAGTLRADEVEASLPGEQAVGGAPQSLAGLFRVPRVLSG